MGNSKNLLMNHPQLVSRVQQFLSSPNGRLIADKLAVILSSLRNQRIGEAITYGPQMESKPRK